MMQWGTAKAAPRSAATEIPSLMGDLPWRGTTSVNKADLLKRAIDCVSAESGTRHRVTETSGY
jgi:hypothetical protein